MFGSKTDKLRKAHDKLLDELLKMGGKLRELRAKIEELEAQNRSLEGEAGELLARINLGELPEEERAKAEEKLKQMELNRLEIKGLQSAIAEMRKRIKSTLEEVKNKRIELYLALREDVMKELEKAIDEYNETSIKHQRAFGKLMKLVSWLNTMEAKMQRVGYKLDKKPQEKFGRLFTHWQIDAEFPNVQVLEKDPENGYVFRKASSRVSLEEMLPGKGWEFLKVKFDEIPAHFEPTLSRALGVRSLKEVEEVLKEGEE